MFLRIIRHGRGTRWWAALALMFLVVLLGLLGYMLIARMSFLHALYATVITITTVGYEDRALSELTDPLLVDRVMVFEIVLVIFGISVVAYAFSLFVSSLVEGEIRDAIGLHRTKRRLLFMKDHFIVCGFGRMGEIIADLLQKEGIRTVVIEIDPGRRSAIEARGGICLVGDATHDDLLEEAAIEKAKGLIAVTDSDPENLFITLSARQINPDMTIVARCLSPDAENKLLRAGANRVILPEKIGAHQMAQAALRPNVVDFIDIATRTSNLDIEIEEMCVAPKADIAGKTLQEATILRSLGLIVIGIRHGARGQMEFNPSAQTRIGPGDTLILLGKRDGLTQLRPYVA